MKDDTLNEKEPHPATHIALKFIMQYLQGRDISALKEALSRTANAGNRTAQICLGTLERFTSKEPVSDRYLMGLAWFIFTIKQAEDAR